MKNGRRWLVFSYFTKVDGLACSQHIDDRIPCFVKADVTPVLLSSICCERHNEIINKRVPSVLPSGIRYELRRLRRRGKIPKGLASVLNIIIMPFYLIEKLVVDMDSQWSWFPLAAWQGNRLCHRYKPEIIYSTGGPSSAHVAAFIVSYLSGVPWVAEFQDPLVYSDSNRSFRARWLYKIITKIVCKYATFILFLTEEARRRAALWTGLGDKGRVIYPGSEPSLMPDVLYNRTDVFRITYLGSLYGTRNLKVFLQGLGLLFESRPELANFIHLEIYGTTDSSTIRDIQSFPLHGVIKNFGVISRRDSLVAMRQSDVLLMIQHTDSISEETIPSKIYEYFQAERPVLGLIHKNKELELMFTRLGHYVAAADDPYSVKQVVSSLYDLWQNNILKADYFSTYTVEEAVSQLILDVGVPLSLK